MFTYYLEITNQNLEIKFYLSSKKIKGWHEKYIVKNNNGKITFNLDAPMKFSKKNIIKLLFISKLKILLIL